MSKVTSMSTGAIDPIVVTKRVFWRPATTGTDLRIGDAVCYKLDAVDHKERAGAVRPPTDEHLGGAGTAYAEGSQTYTGRLFNVEEPLVDNMNVFAGFVKCLGPKAGADGDLIEIFVATNGAVIPCRVGLAATVAGLTVLAFEADNRTLGDPQSDCDEFGFDTEGTSPTRSIGIAMETLTAAGLCWVKIDENMFINQGVNDGATKMLQVGVGTTTALNLTVNKMFLDFKNTDGHSCALHYRTRLSGTGSGALKGVYRFEVMMDATSYGESIDAMQINLEVACSSSQTSTVLLRGLHVMMRTQNSDPDLSASQLAVMSLEMILRRTTTLALSSPSTSAFMFRFNCDAAGSTPTAWFIAANPQAIAYTENTDYTVTDKVAAIKIYVVGATLPANVGYIYVYDHPGQ